VRDKLLWFSFGALAASSVFALFTLRSAPGPGPAPNVHGELAQQLLQIDRRLAVIEARAVAPAITATASAPQATSLETPRRTVAGQRAHDAGAEVVSRAIGSGVWTQADMADLKTASAGMSDAEQLELARQLVVAVNQDRLKIEPGAELQ
jgi:hypothetical protein